MPINSFLQSNLSLTSTPIFFKWIFENGPFTLKVLLNVMIIGVLDLEEKRIMAEDKIIMSIIGSINQMSKLQPFGLLYEEIMLPPTVSLLTIVSKSTAKCISLIFLSTDHNILLQWIVFQPGSAHRQSERFMFKLVTFNKIYGNKS